MKRLLAFILVVAMALAFAGSASAFSWEKPAPPDPEKIGYSIQVIKCTLVTGEAGSSYITWTTTPLPSTARTYTGP